MEPSRLLRSSFPWRCHTPHARRGTSNPCGRRSQPVRRALLESIRAGLGEAALTILPTLPGHDHSCPGLAPDIHRAFSGMSAQLATNVRTNQTDARDGIYRDPWPLQGIGGRGFCRRSANVDRWVLRRSRTVGGSCPMDTHGYEPSSRGQSSRSVRPRK